MKDSKEPMENGEVNKAKIKKKEPNLLNLTFQFIPNEGFGETEVGALVKDKHGNQWELGHLDYVDDR